MSFFLVNFTLSSSNLANAQTVLRDPLTLNLIILAGIVILFLTLLFLLRSILHASARQKRIFDRVILQVLVPKERKSEGQGGQVGQEDRLEHIKEEVGITETFLSTIAGIKSQRGFIRWLTGSNDYFSFEIVAKNGLIYFYIDTPKKKKNLIEQQVHAQFPYAQIDQMIDYNLFEKDSTVVGGYLTTTNKEFLPIKTYKDLDSDPMASILNSLAKITGNAQGSAAVQYVVRSASKSWRRKGASVVREVKKGEKFENVLNASSFGKIFSTLFKELGELASPKKNDPTDKEEKYQLSSMEEEMLKKIEEKLTKGGLSITVRILSVSNNTETAQINLDNLINSFSQLNLYRFGNSFQAVIPRNQTKLIRDFIYRTFDEKRKILLNTEEFSSIWHLPLHSTETPNIKWLGGRKSPPPPNLPKEGLLMGHIPYRSTDTQVFMKEADRRRHLYIIGKSGSGKSVLISNLAIQDIQNNKGVCVVDPHGDLVEDILGHIPKHRVDDVIVFNPSDLERPIGLNMLEARSDDQKDFAVQEMIGIFYKLFPPEMIGPMFEHQMRNVMLTLMADLENPGTVIDIPRMFTDDSYVKQYLVKLKDPVVRAFWEKEMAKTSDFHKSEMLGYLVSKVGRFVGNEMMRNIMGQQRSGFSFRDAMDQQKILLVNLAKGTTGEVNSKLIGLIVVAKLQMAAMGRADMDESMRKDFYLYIDEFQNFTTDSISTILSEARKYRLDLIIAHQYMGQLIDDKGKSDIKDAVLGNVGTMCVGRIGPEDADILAKEFAPTFGAYDLLNPPQYSYYAKVLIDNETTRPFNMLAYPPKEGNRELAKAIKELSRLKYGRDRRIVEAEILERTKLGQSEGAAKTDMIEASL
ncbi:MAG: hypothetical protein COV59_03455 [Candidatus Magasanikbacteria bacterium CG11_big_fil_rev_8_21_14_0_20_39_34]|uniref:Uncharacterized protein n=1 Tax=Candidatus Magasanikbacteria bacterium CG11_big_fil_rev_8_21_14_0_20_39_34 TaxID=1974653 RepID=A0A2H0N5P8_9BACT|nr:MAG: hypothetical protein COV59_03455 [Candidatus Magasanikbacteria bacterium CG11_big_fil_rev_8_21_14_0_20_39_34]